MDSTIEAKYITVLKTVKEVFWFKKFVVKFDVMISNPILFYYDNNGAIVLAKESKSHQKFKHIKRWFHLIRDYLEKKYIEVQRVDTTDNIANPLMKQLSQQKTEIHF